MSMNFRFSLAALCLALVQNLIAAPPEIDPAKDLPRFPAVEPKDVVGTFQIKPGFHLELVANEPLVVDPITVAFDENGRMFVVEMRDYSERRDEKPHLGRIRMLEDVDGDGKFDTATVYAEDLAWPTAVFPWDGGIFVIATPDLYYLKDTNGDGKADVRRIVFTGFGNTRDRLNVQGLANSLNWGLDNRIHGLAAPNGGIITNLVRKTDKPLDCNNRNFSFNPRTFEMFPENGGGQYGMSFNTRGKKFACSNSEHLMMFMYEERYADRNPYYAMPKPLINIAVDGGAAEVYRLSPEEPWRVIRTKWRVSGVATGPIEGGGRASGYFTGATGLTIYRGSAFPPDFVDNAFTGDAGGNLVHRKILTQEDVGYKGQRPADEQKIEFLASKDTWFRPTHFQNAPDGCFYVTDMYREVIEHPWSLPEQLKKHIDLNSGNDRGRVYRIVPDGFKQPALPKLGKAKTAELVALLGNPNGWHRETAARLLYQRQDKTAVPALTRLLESSTGSGLGRMHALYVLDGLGALNEKHILRGLRDSDDRVREHAVKLSEKVLRKSVPSDALWAALRERSKDSSLFVIYQLAFTLGEIQHPERNAILVECLKHDIASPWVRAAVLSSLANGAGEMFDLAAADASLASSEHGQKFLDELITLIGTKKDPDDITAILQFVGGGDDTVTSFRVLRSLNDGLQRAGSSLDQAAPAGSLRAILAKANQVAIQSDAAPANRLQAIQLLATSSYRDAAPTLLSLLSLEQPQDVQLAALTTLGKFNDPNVAVELINRWNSLSPRLRTEAISILLARPDRALALLQAIQNTQIRRTDLTTPQAKFLRNHQNASVKQKAVAVLGTAQTSQRQAVVDAFMQAAGLKGNAEHGKAIYLERCVSCHRLQGQGFALGPDLVTVQNTGKEKMLLNILDPNREVAPQYQAYEVETKDGESVIGIIGNENATSVTVKQAYGKEDVILRSNIKKMQSQQQSLMPEGLEAGLKMQDIADLLEYVLTAK